MKTKDAVNKLMDDVIQLLEMRLEERDWVWRHQMADHSTTLAKFVGLTAFEYDGKQWIVNDDLKSVREVTEN